MKLNYLNLKLQNQLNKRNNVFALIIVLFGGSLGLLFNANSILKIIFCIIGFILGVFYLNLLIKLEQKINITLKEVNENDRI